MKKTLLAIALIMTSSLAMAIEKGPWELVSTQKAIFLYICHYQRVETIDTLSLVNNAYTVGYGRCIAPTF